MIQLPIVPREQANRDVERAINHHLMQAGPEVALDFVGALERAYAFIAEHPEAGSPRFAHELDLPGLRHWMLKPFPWLVFYLRRADHIDVWRVLHAHSDIPAGMRDDDTPPEQADL